MRLVCIVGPTASGKSALALDLAERLGGEIVSADSRQVYRDLEIGTAKPTAAERARVPHHCLDLVAPGEAFDAARFRDAARAAIADIVRRGRVALVVGGTGLYVRALLGGLCPAPPRVTALRAALAEEAAPALHRRLRALDPAAAARIAPGDRVRIVRALEVALVSGVPLSRWQAEHRFGEPAYDALLIGLARPTAELDARLAARARVRGARAAATRTYLDFERPLEPLDAEVARLAGVSPGTPEGERLRRLRAERRRVQQELLARLTPWERVQLSRHPDRPSALDYLGVLCRDLVELHGDRRFGEDGAIVGGLARFRGHAVVVVAEQRGRSTAERVLRNFGMPRPEGYRKAVRLFELAERFARPVITLIDTQGAYPGIGAEERGQAEAIAASLRTLAGLRVPVVSAVIGEGGNGGALALALADRVLMQEHAWYSVISPEGCASILFRERTPETVAPNAALLRLTAAELAQFGVVDEIVAEPGGGAHRQPARAAVLLGRALERQVVALRGVPAGELVAHRYARYRRIGTDLPAV